MTKSVAPKKTGTKAPAVKKTVVKTRAGFVAIIGAPNAGKSTLLNYLIGQKVSIVSPKAQTTRIRTLGILTEDKVQISFIDTPGIFAPQRRLDRAMVSAAWNSLEDADAVVLLVDASKRLDEKTETIVKEIQKRKASVILALNKVDAVARDKLLPVAAKLNEAGCFSDVFMVSALTGDGVEDLKTHLKNLMPVGPWFFGEDQVSDLPSQILAAELTGNNCTASCNRNCLMRRRCCPKAWRKNATVPSSSAKASWWRGANHRPIILGKGGAHIKSIGERARADIARVLDRPVHLFLDVKADEKWQDRPAFYQMFGLDFGKK